MSSSYSRGRSGRQSNVSLRRREAAAILSTRRRGALFISILSLGFPLLFNSDSFTIVAMLRNMRHLRLLVLLPLATHSYSLLGCFTPSDKDLTLPPPMLSLSVGSLSVQTCAETCESQTNASLVLMQAAVCTCYTPPGDSLSGTWDRVNPVECSQLCSNGLPCGETVHARYSVYQVDASTRNITLPPLPSGNATTTGSANPSGNPTIVTNADIGSGNGTDVKKILLIAGICLGILAFLVILAIGLYLFRKAQRSRKLPGPEWMLASSSYLIPGLLPATPNNIYSVITPFMPLKPDEMVLKTDHVVTVRDSYADQWAFGHNVTTGERGLFPLMCLISDEKWLKAGPHDVPERMATPPMVATTTFSDSSRVSSSTASMGNESSNTATSPLSP